MLVAPSILAADFGNLVAEVEAVCGAGCDLLHLDIMDGHFVPNLTFGPAVIAPVAKVANKPLDVHLMVQNNSFFIDLFAPFKPEFISFHIENEPHASRIAEQIRTLGSRPGVVLNPHTSLDSIEYLLECVDMVLLMSVNPGFGGQRFIPMVLEKVKRLKDKIESRGLNCLIEVDGGVCAENIMDLKAAGVDIVVAGSYIFGGDYKERIASLR